MDTRQKSAAIIEHPNDVTLADPARFGIVWVHAHGLAAANLRLLAHRTVVELAVQPGARLIRHQVQGETLRERTSEPLPLVVPGGVTDTIAVAEIGNGPGEDLDLARRRAQRVRDRIAAKPLEHRDAVLQHRPQIQRRPLAKALEV